MGVLDLSGEGGREGPAEGVGVCVWEVGRSGRVGNYLSCADHLGNLSAMPTAPC